MRSSNGAEESEVDELVAPASGSLDCDVVGVTAAPVAELLLVDVEGPSDAVGPSSPLTLGPTTSDDDTDPDGPSPVALDALEALEPFATVVVDEGVLVRCNAARTEEGDNGAGR